MTLTINCRTSAAVCSLITVRRGSVGAFHTVSPLASRISLTRCGRTSLPPLAKTAAGPNHLYRRHLQVLADVDVGPVDRPLLLPVVRPLAATSWGKSRPVGSVKPNACRYR